MGAAMLSAPELAIEQSEANMLAQATADVARHYPSVKTPIEITDWIGLITVCGMVYGPRLVAIRNNRRNARTAAPSFNVVREATRTEPIKPAPVHPVASAPHADPEKRTGRVVDIPGMPGVRILRPDNT